MAVSRPDSSQGNSAARLEPATATTPASPINKTTVACRIRIGCPSLTDDGRIFSRNRSRSTQETGEKSASGGERGLT